MSLYLTEDNLPVFMRSMRQPTTHDQLRGLFCDFSKTVWRVNAEALDNLELAWTGKDRENDYLYSPTKVFLVMVT